MKEKNTAQIIDSLEKQLDHRLDKLWKIFSWTSSILIAICGGVIALTRKGLVELGVSDRILFSIVVIVLATYGILWIKENLNMEEKIRNQLDKIFTDNIKYSDYTELRPDKAKFGYKIVIWLLGITAIMAIWVDLIPSCIC